MLDASAYWCVQSSESGKAPTRSSIVYPPDGVTCDENCQRIPTCGDGYLDPGEECDPPDGENCDDECQWICGDGVVQPGEDCDPPDGVTCDDDCQRIPTCGDGFLDPGEECDDGGTTPGDGCDENCQIENQDFCADAWVVTEGVYEFDTTGATTDGLGHASCQFDGQTYNDIWFRFTPLCTGDLTIDLCGSDYDTDLVVYDTCDCIPGDADLLGCNDDGCPGEAPESYRSTLTVPVVLGNCYLIRVGGYSAGDEGLGTMVITCAGPLSDPLRGGLLWDKWWVVSGDPEPSGEHPLYPPVGQRTGSTTFRCKECHGWDYQGVDGAYGSGSHYTGIPGVYGSSMTSQEMFDLINLDSGPSGHGYENYGLADQDIWDLVGFVQTRAIDTDTYIDGATQFIGDADQGQVHYEFGLGLACVMCHGFDGTSINFGTPEQPVWVGTIAAQNPYEMLHKTRFGQPGTPMSGWLQDGGVDQGAADIGRYAQLFFPVDCTGDGHCDDGDWCNGLETCVDRYCQPGTPPALEIDCNENGVDDRCDTPGDVNADGVFDLNDWAAFPACWTGPCGEPPCDPWLYLDECCVIVDYEKDGDTDLADFAAFQDNFSPP